MLEVIGRRANRPAYSEWQDVMDDNDKAKDQALAPPPAPTRMPRVRSAAQLGQQLVSVGQTGYKSLRRRARRTASARRLTFSLR